jgi:hypothetical protein
MTIARLLTRSIFENPLHLLQNFALIVLHLNEIVPMIFLDRLQQRTLCKDGIASQQFQARIHCKKFSEVLFQATRFVGFVSFNRPTGKVKFQSVREGVEHVNGLTVFVGHLFGGFAIDGGDECRFLKKSIEKLGEGFLQIVERDFSQNAGEGDGVRNAFFGESQKGFELCQLAFCPSFNFGECGMVAEESEQNDGKEGRKAMGFPAFSAGIGNFFEKIDEDFGGTGFWGKGGDIGNFGA